MSGRLDDQLEELTPNYTDHLASHLEGHLVAVSTLNWAFEQAGMHEAHALLEPILHQTIDALYQTADFLEHALGGEIELEVCRRTGVPKAMKIIPQVQKAV